MPAYMDEVVGSALLPAPNRALKTEEQKILWDLFRHVEAIWFPDLPDSALTLKGQWLDYLHAMVEEAPSYLGEYENAVGVYNEIASTVPDQLDVLIFQRSVKGLVDGSTRLDHVKINVINPFIRIFVALVGFKAFLGRNYTGYMGGSRFGDRAPVRVGVRK
jgi:hypothetical protein